MGVFIDDKLKFHTHAAFIITKANRILAVIHRSFHFTSISMFISH